MHIHILKFDSCLKHSYLIKLYMNLIKLNLHLIFILIITNKDFVNNQFNLI